jgi:molybdenum cofactor guanylyltransferase
MRRPRVSLWRRRPRPRQLMAEVEGFILAGGASSRMGVDKAGLRLGGESLVERAAAVLRGVAARVSLVSARDEAAAFGLPVIRDIYAGRGAIGGLHAALINCRTQWAAILACDLPFATSGLLMRLSSLRGPNVGAVAPIQADGRPQPLCAFYAARPCAVMAQDLIEAGELRPRELLRRVKTRWVEFGELSDLPGAADFFRNVNTRADYGEARRLAGETL